MTLTGLAIAAPAASAAPEPATPSFGASIDPLASYDPQRTCSPTAKPGTSAFSSLIKRTYGSSQTVYIGRACSVGGTSEHKEGRALDWMRSMRVASQRDQVDTLVRWLMRTDQYGNRYAMVRRLGVMYMIWKGRMWRAYDPGRGWTEYNSCLSRYTSSAYDTMCHRDHIHISQSWRGARAQTTWFTSASPQVKACSATGTAQAPSLPSVPVGFVPRRQARVVNTATGTGTGSGKCRLVAGTRAAFQVTGKGGVPTSGVSAVAVKARLASPSKATRLTVFPAGTARPSGFTANAAAGQKRVAATVVPVSKDGKVAVALSSGSSQFSLDVLGYYRTSGGVPYRASAQERILTTTLKPGQTMAVRVGGRAGIPQTGVRGVVLGGHVWGPSAAGGLAAWSADPAAVAPSVPAVPFVQGRTASGRIVVPSTSDGRIKIQNRSAAAVQMSLDTAGWFGSGARYHAMASRTVMNTQADVGIRNAFGAGRTAVLSLDGSRVPAGAQAAILQVGALNPTRNTRISAWATGGARPGTAGQLFPRAGQTASEVVVVPLSSDRRVSFSNRSGSVHLRANLLGYYG